MTINEPAGTPADRILSIMREGDGAISSKTKLVTEMRERFSYTKGVTETALAYLTDTVGWVALDDEGTGLHIVNDPQNPEVPS